MEIKWIIPNAQKNIMEPIHLVLSPAASRILTLRMKGRNSDTCFRAVFPFIWETALIKQKGESFYYTSDKTHYLSSRSGASIIWVSSPPSF